MNGRTHGNRQKYENPNPAQRCLIGRFQSEVARLVEQVDPATILEVGCGEGFALRSLVDHGIDAELRGVDLSESAVAQARERLGPAATVDVADVADLAGAADRFDLVMMLEVLEHIPQPRDVLPVLEQVTARHVLLSVPWEPWFRGLNLARGKHIRALGNDPEHVNHWNRRRFQDFVRTRFDIEATGSAFPWTLVLARTRTD